MANQVPFGRFSTTITFSDMGMKMRSNQIREGLFRLAEPTHSEPQKKGNNGIALSRKFQLDII